ncbi:hypothetical protein WJX77_004075 [Trebouxia sp. C0004]
MARPGPQVVLTLKEFVRLPIPKLKRRVTKRASNNNTCARRPRTFAEILVWESLFPEAISRFEALDDKAHCYLPQVVEPLSNLAPKLGLDLLLRECRNTDVNHLSAAGGIIEVKGAWQLSLPDNMSLGEALDHPDYCRELLPALQQAYGDAVVEEAPIFLSISNYDVTFFCRQHLSEVGDKRMWASRPLHGTRFHCPLVQLGCISWL